MSENAINAALRRMSFRGDEQTGHGFRTIASTLLNELGWHPDLIELQLAHGERNKVRAAYNKARRLEERRSMMQARADHLVTLRAGDNKVVPLRQRGDAAWRNTHIRSSPITTVVVRIVTRYNRP